MRSFPPGAVATIALWKLAPMLILYRPTVMAIEEVTRATFNISSRFLLLFFANSCTRFSIRILHLLESNYGANFE